jgi:ABC-type bacteriocin/lantibiotic exporter with double-glycine peptidase domain
MFGAIVVIWRGVRLKEEGVISTGELVTFILYSVFIGASIGSIPEYVTAVAEGRGRHRTPDGPARRSGRTHRPGTER